MFGKLLKPFTIVFVLLFLLGSLVVSVGAVEYEPENGVVMIYSGISDSSDEFYKVKNCSGFIVSNSDEGCYVVTTYNGVTLTSEERKECISENNINDEYYNNQDVIKVVVNGDVETELTVVAQSEVENFVILRADNVINTKSVVKLGNDVLAGDDVYTLGFINKTDEYMMYDKNNVVRCVGTVKDACADVSDTTYIRHSAYLDSGCDGGPLTDKDGYVVGLNNSSITDDDYYALCIGNIKKILDNYSINYSCYDFDQAYEEYTQLYNECNNLLESGNYTTETSEILRSVVSEAEMKISDINKADELNELINTLSNAKEQLVLKTSTIRKIIYVMLILLILLLVWLAFVFVSYMKHKKHKESVADNSVQSENVNLEAPKNDVGYITPVHRRTSCVTLTQLSNNQVVKIDKYQFYLGTKKEEVDYVVDNRAVSRKHAVIRLIGDNYTLFDLNSANGTYVNDMIVDEDGKVLKNRDVISLASEQFLFEIR